MKVFLKIKDNNIYLYSNDIVKIFKDNPVIMECAVR